MDWKNVPFNETDSCIIDGCNQVVPKSCCFSDSFWIDPEFGICEGRYEQGCISRLSIIIHRSALYIGTGAVAIALIQVSHLQTFSI